MNPDAKTDMKRFKKGTRTLTPLRLNRLGTDTKFGVKISGSVMWGMVEVEGLTGGRGPGESRGLKRTSVV